MDPSGRNLNVVDAGLAKVSGFAGHGGDLTELDAWRFALPSDATPFGLVVICTSGDD